MSGNTDQRAAIALERAATALERIAAAVERQARVDYLLPLLPVGPASAKQEANALHDGSGPS